MAPQSTVNGRIAYQFTMGRAPTAAPAGGPQRNRLTLFMNVQNNYEPRESWRVQRRNDVAVLPSADDGE